MVLELEGGYVNHPDDPGGETKYGISRRAYPSVDIKNLTEETAARIYKTDYWHPIASRVREPRLRLLAFDSAVNHGVPRTLKWLKTYDTFDSFLANRIRFYAQLETFDTFGRGWMRRVAHVVSIADRLSSDRQVADTVIDHRPLLQRLVGAFRGSYGPAKFRVRRMTDAPGTKLDVAS